MRLSLKSLLSPLMLLTFAVAFGGNAWGQSYTIADIGKGDLASSAAHAMNSNGQIVGAIGGAHGDNLTAFFWGGQGPQHVIGRPLHSDYSEAFGINSAGTVVGSANLESGMTGFTWSRSTQMALLPPLAGDSSSVASGINDAGVIIGFSSGPNGTTAVAWQGQAPHPILDPSLNPSEALAVGASGVMVGFYGSGDSAQGFSLGPQGMTTLSPLPGDVSSEAMAVNGNGEAAGTSSGANGTRAVRWTATGPINLGFLLGGDHSAAFGINSAGQIVGSSSSNMGLRAFLWSAGAGIQDLNSLIPASSNVILASAVAINDAGQIVAIGNNGHDLAQDRQVGLDLGHHSGVTRVYLLTPVK
jgi:probable HAF family extracellular repeat protein